MCIDTATTELYTLSLHDALPISARELREERAALAQHPDDLALALRPSSRYFAASRSASARRSEEHTSELQSLRHLVCRLLLEKKKKTITQQVDAIDPTSKIDV